MKIMVVGSGGREHAIVLALKRSKYVSAIFCAPGNAGIAEEATCLETDLTNTSLLQLVKQHQIDLTIVGPEVPLVAGVVDLFEAEGLRIFGPNQKAAQLEGSKRFCKTFLAKHEIPTASYRCFADMNSALEHLKASPVPIVVKDSNLAAGKGVTVASSKGEAQAAIESILLESINGELVIEDFLEGQEVSLLVFMDGEAYAPMILAQDYKQAYNGDEGDMTGGMGTVAPVELLSQQQLEYVNKEIIEKTLEGFRKDNIIYRGVLFIGLMVTQDDIKVLEFNCRFGDPETQVVLPLLKTDIVDVFNAVIDGQLSEINLEWADEAAACIVMAAPGYPSSYPKGITIGIPELESNITIIHAGTDLKDGKLVSSGGRVLGVTAKARDTPTAIQEAYNAVEKIDFPGAHYRTDIGARLKEP